MLRRILQNAISGFKNRAVSTVLSPFLETGKSEGLSQDFTLQRLEPWIKKL